MRDVLDEAANIRYVFMDAKSLSRQESWNVTMEQLQPRRPYRRYWDRNDSEKGRIHHE